MCIINSPTFNPLNRDQSVWPPISPLPSINGIVETPPHYNKKIQPIDLINAFNLNFSIGNILKYACRAGRKEGEDAISDLKKIIDYANFEIKRIEDARNESAH